VRFANQVVIVTGGGSGIGAAAGRRLAAEGAEVWLTGRTESKLAAQAAQIAQDGGQAVSWVMDAGLADDWRVLRQHFDQTGKTVDVIVHNAYTLDKRPAGDLAEESWNYQLAVDLSAVYFSVRNFLDHLRSRHGNMVNVASVHGLRAWPGHPAYGAAKGGMLALTRQLAVEYGPDVRFNAVVPGPILTPTWDGVSPCEIDSTARGTALGRLGTADEVANAIAFLASSEASYITGEHLVVDGGQTVRGSW
jgi:NAD(P)-dependent dehydrogenase (short-subunit alcohol dehydrogenase family)